MAFKLFIFAAFLAMASAGIIPAPVHYAAPLSYSSPYVKTVAAAPVYAHSSSSIIKTVNTVPQVYSAPVYAASAYTAPAYAAPAVAYSVPTYAKVAAPLTYASAGWA